MYVAFSILIIIIIKRPSQMICFICFLTSIILFFSPIDSLLLVADRFDGPSNVDVVIGTIHARIAEAISNMQENKESITAKVRIKLWTSEYLPLIYLIACIFLIAPFTHLPLNIHGISCKQSPKHAKWLWITPWVFWASDIQWQVTMRWFHCFY